MPENISEEMPETYMHSVNEYTTIKDLVTGAELIAGLITDEQ